MIGLVFLNPQEILGKILKEIFKLIKKGAARDGTVYEDLKSFLSK